MSGVAGFTSNTVPWEILRAAGYKPRLLNADDGPTPIADRFMEPVFDRRIRVIFDRLCSGVWSDLKRVVISRASEQEHKLYLYLREMARARGTGGIPELYLYDLLHTRTPEAYRYGLDRTREMVRALGVSEDALAAAIHESNRARSVVREIHRLRASGLMEGSVAYEQISGFYSADRSEFAQRVLIATEVLRNQPRVLIKGVELESNALHRVIEGAGAYVVGEDDWRGSRAAGDQNVRTDLDPVTSIFNKYVSDEMAPRVQTAGERDAWFHRTVHAGGVDAVIFYLPLEDDVLGWDYPRQAEWLSEQKVPSFVMRKIASSVELDKFVSGVKC